MMTRRCISASVGLLLAVIGGCGDDDSPRRATPTVVVPGASATRSVTATSTRTTTGIASSPTPSPADTATVPALPTATATHTVPTHTASPTATPQPPQITYFGVARADDLVQTTELFDVEGRPIFARVQGQGMSLVLEASRGTLPLADAAYDPFGGLPGAQFIVSRPLGDGSATVCDFDPPIIGGIPATVPLVFSGERTVIDAINDLGCRVNDGTGAPRIRFSGSACTRDVSAEFLFVNEDSDGQFCLPIARAWGFPPGDTIVAARVQDVRGNVSEPREIVLRVAGDVPFDCESGLGERAFTAGGPLTTVAIAPPLGSGVQPADTWAIDPLRLCAGLDLGGDVHPLALRTDAVIGIPAVDGSVVCLRFLARGSSGTIDCDGGTAQDVRASQDEQGNSGIRVDTGLGLPAFSGAASMRLQVGVRQLPSGSDPAACREVREFDLEVEAALTTTTGTAEVLDGMGNPLLSVGRSGAGFDCQSWRSEGPGTLVLPIPAVNTVVGDLALVLVLDD
jgi:hypothetical protein